jgi:hypothetical protein
MKRPDIALNRMSDTIAFGGEDAMAISSHERVGSVATPAGSPTR